MRIFLLRSLAVAALLGAGVGMALGVPESTDAFHGPAVFSISPSTDPGGLAEADTITFTLSVDSISPPGGDTWESLNLFVFRARNVTTGDGFTMTGTCSDLSGLVPAAVSCGNGTNGASWTWIAPPATSSTLSGDLFSVEVSLPEPGTYHVYLERAVAVFTSAGGGDETVAQDAGNPIVLIVADITPPTWTLSDITTATTADLGAMSVSWGALASDNVGVTSESCVPASGSWFPLGSTTVSCTASDAAGNVSNGQFHVTVNLVASPPPAPEPVPPAFDPPASLSGVNPTTWGPGTVDELSAAVLAAGGVSVTAFVDGKPVVFVPTAPPFVNAAFNAAFPDGIPAGTILLVVK